MTSQTEWLARRYGFESWSSEKARAETLFIWRFAFFGRELAGWTPHRVQTVQEPPAPPMILSIWRPSTGEGKALLSVIVHELPSRQAAYDTLLRLLGEFQGPELVRRPGLGDVAFASGSAAVLFARGNLVLLVRNAEREPAPVAQTAETLDAYIAARPQPTARGGPETLSVRVAAAGPVAAGRPIPLVIEATPPREGKVWYKIFSSTGEVRLEGEGGPAYVPGAAGPHAITVIAVGSDGSMTAQELKLD